MTSDIGNIRCIGRAKSRGAVLSCVCSISLVVVSRQCCQFVVVVSICSQYIIVLLIAVVLTIYLVISLVFICHFAVISQVKKL